MMSRSKVRVCEFCTKAFAKDKTYRVYIIAKDTRGCVRLTETIGLMDESCFRLLAEFLRSIRAKPSPEGALEVHEMWEKIEEFVKNLQQS